MASLTNTKIKDTYDGLLKTTDNDALGGTYKLITDGLGNSSGVYLGTGGNVGIGTNQPQTLVQLSNNNSSTNSEQGAISFAGDTATRYSQISGFRFNNSNQAGLDFKVYNGSLNNAMRIKNDGNVGIGDSNPGAKLVVAQPQIVSGGFSTPFIELKSTAQTNNTGLVAMSFSTSTADNYGYSIGALRGSSGGASSFVISHHDNSLTGSERMRITSSGRIHFYNLLGSSATQSDVRYDTTSKEMFYNTSSERYKTDIVDLENTLDKVNSLRAVRYKDIETEQETTGLIAEEVIEIIPEVVFKKEIEGFDEPQPEGINYSDFAPFLIKAIQELKAEIETLKSQINS